MSWGLNAALHVVPVSSKFTKKSLVRVSYRSVKTWWRDCLKFALSRRMLQTSTVVSGVVSPDSWARSTSSSSAAAKFGDAIPAAGGLRVFGPAAGVLCPLVPGLRSRRRDAGGNPVDARVGYKRSPDPRDKSAAADGLSFLRTSGDAVGKGRGLAWPPRTPWLSTERVRGTDRPACRAPRSPKFRVAVPYYRDNARMPSSLAVSVSADADAPSFCRENGMVRFTG